MGVVFKLLNHARCQALSPRRIMYRDKKVVVVMPAYNAAKTLRQTYAEVREQGLVDRIIGAMPKEQLGTKIKKHL